jgi:hypothetical protein
LTFRALAHQIAADAQHSFGDMLLVTGMCSAATEARRRIHSTRRPRRQEPPPLKEPPKIQGAPDLVVDNEGPKVGFARVLIERRDGRERLAAAIAEHKQHFQDKTATLRVDRRAKPDWVSAMIEELGAAGANHVLVKSESRKVSARLTFTPQSKLGKLVPCTVVTMILADRGTATWKITGGTAGKRTKGFAGPDLTTTSETLERYAKACKDSKLLLVSGAEGVEWGLIYDLAASSSVEDVSFDNSCTPRAPRRAQSRGSSSPLASGACILRRREVSYLSRASGRALVDESRRRSDRMDAKRAGSPPYTISPGSGALGSIRRAAGVGRSLRAVGPTH